MKQDIAEIAGKLTTSDVTKIKNAWQGSSGTWYINGRVRHLYAADISRMTGVLTPFGLAVRAHLLAHSHPEKQE